MLNSSFLERSEGEIRFPTIEPKILQEIVEFMKEMTKAQRQQATVWKEIEKEIAEKNQRVEQLCRYLSFLRNICSYL